MDNIEQKLKQLDTLQKECTHCGICLEACITYQASGWEHQAPRGRIRLAHDLMDGRIRPDSAALETFDHCLGCHACEQACPVNVNYSGIRSLVQEIRRDMGKVVLQPDRKWSKAAKRMGFRLWRHFMTKPGSFLHRWKKREGNITLVVGCVQDVYQHELIACAIHVLEKLGCKPTVDRNQPCCGAISNRILDKHEPESCFLKWLPKNAYFLSRGCCEQVNGAKDICELILEIIDQKNIELVLPTSMVVYYQPYCREKKPVENDWGYLLLKKIKNLTVHLIPFPEACCGGYCGETLLNPDNAKTWIYPKTKNLPHNATVIVTSPDCHYQFATHTQGMTIFHPVQIVSRTSA